jgi:dihydroorotate dehydrogenase
VIYRLLFKLVLQHIPPEATHSLAAGALWALGRIPGFNAGLRRWVGRTDPRLQIRAFGLTFPSPLGVAAGADKNLTWFHELGALGFGFVEVGTVTARAQPGNPKPRIHRLPARRALINSMGFPNDGAQAAATRLARRSGRPVGGAGPVLAVNVGKSKVATDAVSDYRESIRLMAPYADLLVLNVSSPNTPGLRDLQAVQALRDLVGGVQSELSATGIAVPLLVKIAPDLSDEEIGGIAAAAVELGLSGIVAVNTTTSRKGLRAGEFDESLSGGLSGAPLKARALEVLQLLRQRTLGELVLVSVGGVETAEDVLERVRAGASLVQTYTGFVYGGPLWPSRVNREVAHQLRRMGVSSLQELVGRDAGPEQSASTRGAATR